MNGWRVKATTSPRSKGPSRRKPIGGIQPPPLSATRSVIAVPSRQRKWKRAVAAKIRPAALVAQSESCPDQILQNAAADDALENLREHLSELVVVLECRIRMVVAGTTEPVPRALHFNAPAAGTRRSLAMRCSLRRCSIASCITRRSSRSAARATGSRTNAASASWRDHSAARRRRQKRTCDAIAPAGGSNGVDGGWVSFKVPLTQ